MSGTEAYRIMEDEDKNLSLGNKNETNWDKFDKTIKAITFENEPFHEVQTSNDLKDTSSFKRDEIRKPNIILDPPKASQQDKYTSLQKWQGVVTKIGNESFFARLYDLTHENPTEIAEIPMVELSPDEAQNLEEGLIFYWNIGYLDKINGQRIRESFIRFRNIPTWNEEDFEAAKRRAQKLKDYFDSKSTT